MAGASKHGGGKPRHYYTRASRADTRSHQPILGFQLLFAVSVAYCLIGTVTVRYIRGVKR